MRYLRICGLLGALALSAGALAACSTVSGSGSGPSTTALGAGQAGSPTTRTPGSKTSGSKTSGSKTSGSKTSGSKTSGSKTSGSKTYGSATPASAVSGSATTQPPVLSAPLPTPAAIPALVSPALPGEGQWSPAGRQVDGTAAVFETTLRPPGAQSPAGIAWMDTSLLAAQLYSGSVSPGGGPWQFSAPIQPTAAASLVAAFNGGFMDQASDGGYYTQGRVVLPLRVGAASLVIYSNGNATVGQWGRDVTMTSSVVGVRQNLNLLVDAGQPVGGLNPADTTVWGYTLGNTPYVWRSAVGVTAAGALVYVAGPSLDITQLADLLVAAGVVRGMELDINPDWTTMATYAPSSGLASPANGTDLLPGMVQSPGLFFDPSWARDFVTMSARSGPIP